MHGGRDNMKLFFHTLSPQVYETLYVIKINISLYDNEIKILEEHNTYK